MVVIAYVINLLAPIMNFLGALGICWCLMYEDFSVLVMVAILAALGLVFGIFAYGNDIPPRWFWSKSKNELFSFSVTAVLGYAVNFAMWPSAIYMVIELIEKVQQA
jgi:hypothetical protein